MAIRDRPQRSFFNTQICAGAMPRKEKYESD